MHRWLLLGAGVLARLAGLAAALYSDWLLAKLQAGGRATYHLVHDLAAFGDWVVTVLARRCCGTPDWDLEA